MSSSVNRSKKSIKTYRRSGNQKSFPKSLSKSVHTTSNRRSRRHISSQVVGDTSKSKSRSRSRSQNPNKNNDKNKNVSGDIDMDYMDDDDIDFDNDMDDDDNDLGDHFDDDIDNACYDIDDADDSENDIILPIKKPRKSRQTGFYGRDRNHMCPDAQHGRESTKSDYEKQIKWIKKAPGQTLVLMNGRVYCQACSRYTHDSCTGVLRHCGLDMTPSGQKTNKGIKHKQNVKDYNSKAKLKSVGNVGIGSGIIKIGTICGLNYSQIAKVGDGLCKKYSIVNDGDIAKDVSNVYSKAP
eukprot:173685_1